MSEENKKDPEAKSGELIRTPPLPLGPARTSKGRTIDRLLSMLSIWPFRNRAFTQSLDTARDVIEKQTKLEDAIIGHGQTRGRLNDRELTLEQDRLQRRREFIEERNRLSIVLNDFMLDQEMMAPKNKIKSEEIKRQQRGLEVQRLKLEKSVLLLKKELDELKKLAAEPPKKPTTRARSEKQKLRESAYTRHEKEIRRIEAVKATFQTKADLIKAAQNELEEELERIRQMP